VSHVSKLGIELCVLRVRFDAQRVERLLKKQRADAASTTSWISRR